MRSDCSALLKAVQSAEPRWLRLEDEIGWSSPQADAFLTIEDAIERHVRDHPPGKVGSRRLRFAAVSTAASLMLIATLILVASLTRKPAPNPKPTTATATVADPIPLAPTRPSDLSLAILLQLDGARWAPSGSKPAVGEFLKPGRFQLRSGRATLSMLNGVLVVIEGPADLDLLSVDEIYCRQGKLRTQVPEGAEGFVVSGPGTAVVDLGTEFALNHTPGGRARGRVYKGLVEATVLSPTGTPQRSQVLRESKTFEINPGADQIDTIEGTERFTGPSNLAATPLILDPAYPRAVLDSKPWAYWRFETLEHGLIPNQIAGGSPLETHGPVRLTPASEGNRCVEFVAGDTNQYLSMAEPWKPTQNPGYAVELWFLSTAISHASLVNLVAPPDSHYHFFMLELTSRNRLTLHKPASIRFVNRLPAAYSGGDSTFSDQFYIPYRWHHLVGQIQGDRMELFLDGEPTPPLTISPDQATPAGQFLLGRLSTMPQHSPGTSRPFYGRMDEVAIYNHALTGDEIRRHFQAAAPRSGKSK